MFNFSYAASYVKRLYFGNSNISFVQMKVFELRYDTKKLYDHEASEFFAVLQHLLLECRNSVTNEQDWSKNMAAINHNICKNYFKKRLNYEFQLQICVICMFG